MTDTQTALEALALLEEAAPWKGLDISEEARIISAALTAPAEPSPHLCGHPPMGSYDGQVLMVPPEYLKNRWPTGTGIDVCLALEVQNLWKQGIRTLEHCCGHGHSKAYIAIDESQRDEVLALGYEIIPHPNVLEVNPKTNLTAPAEPVGEISRKTHGSYSANYTIAWFSEVNVGDKLYRSPSSDAARIEELERQAAVDKAELAHLGRILKRIRFTLESVAENIEDEGGRVYFGSTNDADELKDIAEEVSNWNMERITKSAELPDLYGDLRSLRARIAKLEAALEAADKFHSACYSAWASGEPKDKVVKMLDAGDEFAALHAKLKGDA